MFASIIAIDCNEQICLLNTSRLLKRIKLSKPGLVSGRDTASKVVIVRGKI